MLCDKPKDQPKPDQPKDKPHKTIEEMVARAKQPPTGSSKPDHVHDDDDISVNSSEKNKFNTGSEGKEPVVAVINTTTKAKISEIMVNNKCEKYCTYVTEESE